MKRKKNLLRMIIKLIYMFAVWEYEGDIRQLITFLNVVKDLVSLALWGRLFHTWVLLLGTTVAETSYKEFSTGLE